VVVLRHQFWQDRFNSNPGIVGRSINLDGHAYTVLGILPASHRTLVGFGVSPDIYLPRVLPDTQLELYARVKPGMSLGQCRMALYSLAQCLDRVMPQPDMKYADDTRLTPLAGFARIQQGKGAVLVGVFFAVVLALAGLVLLIACVNVASLMLVRATVRKQEIAVRLSLGASRARLLQQLLAESLLLSLAGTGAGFVLAQLAAKALAAIQLPIPIPLHLQIEPDWRAVAYAAILGAVATIACGLLPAFQSVRESFTESLHSETRQRLRRVLVTAQVAVSVIVLATGSLFPRNLFLAGATNPGFDVRATLRAEIHLPPEQYRNPGAQRSYVDRALAQLAAIPGIEAAGAARIIPFTDESNHRAVLTFLETGRKRDASFHTNGVSPDFFRAMNIPLLAGRVFNSADRVGAHAVIVNQKFVELYLDGRPPVGASFRWGDPRSVYQIVGVVGGTKNSTIGEDPAGSSMKPCPKSKTIARASSS